MTKKITSLVLILALLMTCALPVALADTMNGHLTMSSGSTLYLRKGAGTKYASNGTVSKGAAIKIYTDQVGKDSSGYYWTKIKVVSTGKTGYVKNTYLSFDSASSKSLSVYVGKNGGKLYVRKGPGTSYSAAGTVQHGAAIRLIKQGSLWSMIQVKSNGLVGYINTSHISGLSTTGSGNLPSGSYTAGTVTTKYSGSNVNIRKSASTNGAIITSVPRNTKLQVLSSSGSWYRVKTKSGITGYMSKSYVAAGFKATVSGSVNFRKGPSTDYGIIKVLTKGTSVSVRSVSGKWAKVTYGGKTGYVHVSYLNW